MTIDLRMTERRGLFARPQPPQDNLGNFVAWCSVMRAVRHQHALLAGRTACLGLVIPHGYPFEIYEEAIAKLGGWLDSKRNGYAARGDIPVFRFEHRRITRSGMRSRIDAAEVTSTVIRSRVVFGLAYEAADFAGEFHAAADAVLIVEPYGIREVRGGARFVAKLDLPDDLAAAAAALGPADLSLAIRRGRSLAQVRASLQRLAKKEATPTKSGPTLETLHGFGPAADWGRQLAADLADWRKGLLPWSEVDRGLLLSGPPGCGKTTFARALAATCGVPLVAGSVARWQAAGHLGQLLAAMKSCFDEARAKAPCIVFLDEVDAFGSREDFSDDHRDYSTQVVAGLLECMDGVEGREGVVVIGAANHPDRLDPAIRRPGRLDRHIEIPLPDARAREGILRFHTGSGVSPDADLKPVVDRTAGWSGAELEQVVRSAKRRARLARRPMVVEDLLAEMPALVALPVDLLMQNAVHESGHVVAALAMGTFVVGGVTIVRAVDPNRSVQIAGGAMLSRQPFITRDRQYYLDDITVLLAGAGAEEMVFGVRSDGWGGYVGSDIHRATSLAAQLEISFGLGEGLAFLAPREDALAALRLNPAVCVRVNRILDECLARAKEILAVRSDVVGRLASALLKGSTLTREEIHDITGIDREEFDDPLKLS